MDEKDEIIELVETSYGSIKVSDLLERIKNEAQLVGGKFGIFKVPFISKDRAIFVVYRGSDLQHVSHACIESFIFPFS